MNSITKQQAQESLRRIGNVLKLLRSSGAQQIINDFDIVQRRLDEVAEGIENLRGNRYAPGPNLTEDGMRARAASLPKGVMTEAFQDPLLYAIVTEFIRGQMSKDECLAQMIIKLCESVRENRKKDIELLMKVGVFRNE